MLELVNLGDRVRGLMIEEVDRDIENGTLYINPRRLSPTGQQDYPGLLKETVLLHDDAWLADQLRQEGRMNRTMQRAKPKGGYTTVPVPVNAPDTLAEGEFNRFYARGLCRSAIEDGTPDLVIYRAKQVSTPREESEARIGTTINAQALLDDLRANPGKDTWLGIPAGPNSGISVRLP
jgi:hypothetical protein